jgi:hypothetical protein
LRRLALASIASAAAIGLTLLGAAPASAAELPADNRLFALSGSEFYSSTSAAALTGISPFTNLGGKYGADYDPTTGVGYYFVSGEPCLLFSIDIATGVSTEIGPVGGVVDFNECDALDVAADGTLRIGDQEGVVLTVDKATGATISSVVSNINPLSFITQAANGAFYAGDYDGGLYTYDPATGVGTPITSPLGYYETASIDSNGTLWISSDGDECSQGLWSFNVADPVGTLLFQGDFLEGTDCVSAFALFVAGPPPAPQLAATGSAPTWVLAPFALLLVLGGAAALAVGRRRRA